MCCDFLLDHFLLYHCMINRAQDKIVLWIFKKNKKKEFGREQGRSKNAKGQPEMVSPAALNKNDT